MSIEANMKYGMMVASVKVTLLVRLKFQQKKTDMGTSRYLLYFTQ